MNYQNLVSVLSAKTQTSVLIIHDIMLNLIQKLFRNDKLGWLPMDDIVLIRKLFMRHKVSQGHCPQYFTSYFKHVRSTHGYHTRSAVCSDVLTPSSKRNSGLKTFIYGILILGNSYRNINVISHSNFKKMSQNN